MKVFSAALILAAVSAINLGKGTCADRIFDQVWSMMDANGDATLTQKEFDASLTYALDQGHIDADDKREASHAFAAETGGAVPRQEAHAEMIKELK